MTKPLFTVVILHYKQPEFFRTAVDSVLYQNYEEIEIIFADDCSGNLTKEQVKQYIETKKRQNIKNIIYQFNEENIGTVKNINRAIENATGEYMLFFAADDKLYGDNVLSNLVENMEKCQEDTMLLCGQSIMMDNELKTETGVFVPQYITENNNEMSADEQHTALLYQSCYALGATIFKKQCFTAFGKFDENLKVIEDWSFFLDYTKRGNKVWYSDIDVLMHRAGGISENGKNVVLSKIYSDDINAIYENRVMPYIKSEKDIDRRSKVLLHYKDISNNEIKMFKYLVENVDLVFYLIYKKLFRRKNNG